MKGSMETEVHIDSEDEWTCTVQKINRLGSAWVSFEGEDVEITFFVDEDDYERIAKMFKKAAKKLRKLAAKEEQSA